MTVPALVSLVGAGPGNSGLLTLRAVECLRAADLVLYDRLVSPRILDHVRRGAECVCVAELAPHHAERCGPVQQTLIDAALAGKRAVRLKGGDPLLFGRGGEEAEALQAAGIPFEIVPGVTAALGAAACAGIPLTHRSVASAVAFLTGHEDPNKPEPELDWPALARFPGTLAVYMALARLESITRSLMVFGKPADTLAAVIQSATTGGQRTVTAPLRDIAAAAKAAGIGSPALVLIGPVVALSEHLAWFERLPLHGQRVLITRPRGQNAELAARLEALGAVPLVLPVLEIRPPASWAPVDAAIDRLDSYQWLVFTSVNGVKAFVDRLRQRGRDLRSLGGLRLAAIGPGTADALRGYHLDADVVPTEYRSEALAAALKTRVAGQRVLLARADRGRDVLREELAAVAEVQQVAVYSQIDAADADSAMLDSLRSGKVDYLLLTSSNSARALARLLDDRCLSQLCGGCTKVVSISPVTSAAIRELGWPVAGEAEVYTTEGVLQALVRVSEAQRTSLKASQPR